MFAILLSTTVVLFLRYLWLHRKYYILWWKIGGPFPIPFTIPISLLKVHRILYQTRTYVNKEGINWYGFSWLGSIPILYISDPVVMQNILTSPKCLSKAKFYSVVTDSFGPGLLTSSNSEWYKSRKLISPSFGQKVLKSFIPIFNEKVNIFMKILENFDNTQKNDTLFTLLAKCTFDITHQTTMGTELNLQTNELSDHWKSFTNLTHTAFERMIKFWLMNKFIFRLSNLSKIFEENKQKVRIWVKNIIENKIEKVKTNDTTTDEENLDKDVKTKSIFIDHAYDLVKRNQFTWNEFENQSIHLLFAGFETTATTIHNIIMLLAMHPKCQEELFEEVYGVFPEKKFDVTYEQIQQMPYLDMVINESLRILPTIPLVGKESSEDFEMLDGVIVPKGTQLILDIFNLHRNPLYWGESAEEFNPEHFLPKNIKDQHPYAYLPFLKGLRNCLGFRYALLALKVILPKFIRNYKFTTDFKFQDLRCYGAVSLKFKVVPEIQIFPRPT